MKVKKTYLIALPVSSNAKGFDHQTILLKAWTKEEAVHLCKYIKPSRNIGDIKKLNW